MSWSDFTHDMRVLTAVVSAAIAIVLPALYIDDILSNRRRLKQWPFND